MHLTETVLRRLQPHRPSSEHKLPSLPQCFSCVGKTCCKRFTSSLCHALNQQRLHCQQHIRKQTPAQMSSTDRTFLTSLYKRKLPQTGIPFSSPRGKSIFKEALSSGSMETFFPLAEQFRTQDEPAYCGLTTLTMILNALQIDPYRTWKGVWRWYHEAMLDCCIPLQQVQSRGVTFSEFICLAECHGCLFETICQLDPVPAPSENPESQCFTSETHIQKFRDVVRSVCTDTAGDRFLVVSYERRALGQTSSGHFSPIGGYHAEKDLVLILDVARFKYPPHWVAIPDLIRAMQTLDPLSGMPRGYAVIRKAPEPDYGQLTLFQITLPPKPEGVVLLSRLFTSLKEICNKQGLLSLPEHQPETFTPMHFVERLFDCFLQAILACQPMWTFCSTARRLGGTSRDAIAPQTEDTDDIERTSSLKRSTAGPLKDHSPSDSIKCSNLEYGPQHPSLPTTSATAPTSALRRQQIIQELEASPWFKPLASVFHRKLAAGVFRGREIEGFDFHGGPLPSVTDSSLVAVTHLFIILFLAIVPTELSLLSTHGWNLVQKAIDNPSILNRIDPSKAVGTSSHDRSGTKCCGPENTRDLCFSHCSRPRKPMPEVNTSHDEAGLVNVILRLREPILRMQCFSCGQSPELPCS